MTIESQAAKPDGAPGTQSPNGGQDGPVAAKRHRIQRLAAWGRPSRLSSFVDFAFKGAALIAALVAAQFFQQPKVILAQGNQNENYALQAFVDVQKLEEYYRAAGKPLPYAVRQTAREYNHHNQQELLSGENVRQYSAEALCTEMPRLVAELFSESQCNPEGSQEPRLGGRERSYEGLLLKLNGDLDHPLNMHALREGLTRLRDAEYLVARYQVKNVGFGYATDVQILPPEQFRPSPVGSFSLAPGESYAVRFESDRGTIEKSPTEQQLFTHVSWDKGAGVITGPRSMLVQILVFVLLGLLAWTIIAETRADRETRLTPTDR
jgi:hypothetical protein